MLVADLPQDDRISFVSDSQDVTAVADLCYCPYGYDSYFVQWDNEKGIVVRVWGMFGTIQYLWKRLYPCQLR